MIDHSTVSGMTVNERLVHFKLVEAFDAAVVSRDLSTIIAILRRAKLTDAQADETATAILADPSPYGY